MIISLSTDCSSRWPLSKASGRNFPEHHDAAVALAINAWPLLGGAAECGLGNSWNSVSDLGRIGLVYYDLAVMDSSFNGMVCSPHAISLATHAILNICHGSEQ